MKRHQCEAWQVILGIIGFLLVMGFVGKIDYDSQRQLQEAQYQDARVRK